MSCSSSLFISFVFAEFNEAENMVMWEKVIKKSFLFDLDEPCLALRLFKEEIDAAKEGFSFQYFLEAVRTSFIIQLYYSL
jgi:hypothetical protein